MNRKPSRAFARRQASYYFGEAKGFARTAATEADPRRRTEARRASTARLKTAREFARAAGDLR